MTKIYDNGIYRDMTAEEIEKVNEEQILFKRSQSYEQLVEQFIREKYSLNAELAILRQRDSKPEEFAEYNAYAEQCKAKAKKLLEI